MAATDTNLPSSELDELNVPFSYGYAGVRELVWVTGKSSHEGHHVGRVEGVKCSYVCNKKDTMICGGCFVFLLMFSR